MSKNKRVKFKKWLCDVKFSTYMRNDQPAIMLVDSHTGDRVAVATASNDQYHLEKNHTWIKDYSENEGIAKALEDAGVIRLTGIAVPTGYTELLEAEILVSED